MDYFIYNASTKTLEPAPRVIVSEDRTIILGAAEDFANYLDAYPRAKRDPAPVPPAGKVAVPDGYRLIDGTWRREWRYIDAPAPSVEDYDAAMEEHLREEREERGYTTREPDAYLDSEVPRWAADARDWVAHRDAVMLYALDILNAVERGESAPSLADFRAGLPCITWSFAENG